MILLDTHFLVWWIMQSDRLNEVQENEIIKASEGGNLYISVISLWEIDLLIRKKKIHLKVAFEEWVLFVRKTGIINILPIDEEVVLATRKLPEEFHSDPADRFITATALLTGLELATVDRKIISSNACKIWKAD